MTNEQLVLRIKSGMEPAANMLVLWQQNTGLIRKIARRYEAYAELEDLLQEGYIGLCNAVDGFNQDEGSFINYAAIWIRQSMKRYIENSGTVIRLPVHLRRRIREYRKAQSLFLQKYAREASDGEMRRFLGLSCKEYDTLKTGLLMEALVSLDAPIKSDEAGENTVGDLVPGGEDPADVAADQRQQEELQAVLWGMVEGLPKDQAVVIRQRYRDCMQFGEIAESMGLSYNQVKTKESKALRELRKPKNSNQLRHFLPGRLHTQALHGSVARFKETWTSSTERVAMKL